MASILEYFMLSPLSVLNQAADLPLEGVFKGVHAVDIAGAVVQVFILHLVLAVPYGSTYGRYQAVTLSFDIKKAPLRNWYAPRQEDNKK